MAKMTLHFKLKSRKDPTFSKCDEKRNVFIIFGEIYTQLSMEKWFMNRNQELYEKYQKLKYRLTWKLEA